MGKPKYTDGKVITIRGKRAGVRYDGSKEIYDTYLSHLDNQFEADDPDQDNVVATVCYNGKWFRKSQTFYTIMASLEVNSALKRSEENEETSWPKDFFEALVRNDWRE